MRIGAVVLSRFDSSRLPGKALAEVEGHPLLWYSIERARAVPCFEGRIVVATSDRAIDDPIAAFAKIEGLSIFRGSSNDVAGRFLGATKSENMDAVARINADCPLADTDLIERGCRAIAENGVEFVTNMHPRTYPFGIVLELFRTDAFAAGYEKMNTPDHFEHVTKYFYDTLEGHIYKNLIRCPNEVGDGGEMLKYRLTIDLPEHLERFRSFVASIKGPWRDVNYMDAVAFGGFGPA
jgi:spore coat polysaccharide biosynthesis protein SpsF